jgi:hypothetical protein
MSTKTFRSRGKEEIFASGDGPVFVKATSGDSFRDKGKSGSVA